MSACSLESLSRSPAFRVIAIGALILCLQVPVLFTYGLMSDRERTKGGAVREIGEAWGLAQEVVGPYIVVPYRTPRVTIDQSGQTVSSWVDRTATFLPESLDINAASMIVALVTSYAWSILGSVSRAASMGGVISGLHAFLYVLISLEDFALLVGSLALFFVLATLMYATRRVDWFELGRPQDEGV